MSSEIESILLANEYLTMYELNTTDVDNNLPRKYLKFKIQKALVKSKEKEKNYSFSNFRKALTTLFM